VRNAHFGELVGERRTTLPLFYMLAAPYKLSHKNESFVLRFSYKNFHFIFHSQKLFPLKLKPNSCCALGKKIWQFLCEKE
jgi:hypothetical protein